MELLKRKLNICQQGPAVSGSQAGSNLESRPVPGDCDRSAPKRVGSPDPLFQEEAGLRVRSNRSKSSASTRGYPGWDAPLHQTNH